MLPVDWMDQIKAAYPRRRGDMGWGLLLKLIPRAIANGADFGRMILGAQMYAKHCEREGLISTPMVKQAQTFYGKGEYWEEWADMDPRTPAQISAQLRIESATKRATAAGFRSPRLNEPLEVYESCLRDWEREQTRCVGQPKFQVVRNG